ncbi:mobile mystery protein B [Thiomicrolovo sp. ZZH C-3]
MAHEDVGGITFEKPGETPLDDISGLIPDIHTRKELDEHEAANLAKAEVDYFLDPDALNEATIDEPFFRKVHAAMLCDVWTWAGTYRTTATSIGVEANQIRQRLYHLLSDLAFWTEHWNYRETATRLHYTLVKIHPFPNGNGRWSRLMTDIWLKKNGKSALKWGSGADLVNAGEERTAYIDALKAADNGDYTPLQNFMFPKN